MWLLSGGQQNELEIYNETFHAMCTDDRNELMTCPYFSIPIIYILWLDHVTSKRDKNVHSSYNLMSSLIFPIKAWKFGQWK